MHVIFSSKIKRKEISSRSRLKSLRALERASNSLYSYIIEYFFMSLLPSLWVCFFNASPYTSGSSSLQLLSHFHVLEILLIFIFIMWIWFWGKHEGMWDGLTVRCFGIHLDFLKFSSSSQLSKFSVLLQLFSNFDMRFYKNCVSIPQ